MTQTLLKDNYFDITINSKGKYDYDILSFQFIDFRRWLNKQGSSGYTTHIVDQTEVGQLDLIAYGVYGSESYWWVLAMANNIMDPVNEVKQGKELIIPTPSAISTYIASLTKEEQRVIEL